MQHTIGIVGAGSIVEKYYINALQSLGYNHTLVYDIDTHRAQTLARQFNLKSVDFNTIQRADVFIVATPPHTHEELITQLLAKNKLVICEKPFVPTKQQAITLITTAEQRDAKLYVAHIRRIFPGIVLAQQYIKQHQVGLGSLLKADLFEGSRFNYKSHSGYVHHNVLGGVLLDTGSHVLDSFMFVTGLDHQPIQCIVQQAKKDKAEPAHEVNYQFQLNDIKVQLSLSRYEVLSNKMNLHFEHALIEIPLGIKPNIAVTTSTGTEIVSAADSCLTYFSQAFKQELRLIIEQQDNRFDASNFVNLSHVLETLYNA